MATDINLPALGENIDSATVTAVLVKAGDPVSIEQAVVEVETEKASVDVPAGVAGTVQQIHVKPGDAVKVGQKLLTLKDQSTGVKEEAPKPTPVAEQAQPAIATPEAAPPAAAKMQQQAEAKPLVTQEPSKPEVAPVPAEEAGAANASPKLRRMARELGIDVSQIKGTGSDGRITEDDVRSQARSIIQAERSGHGDAGVTSLPDFSKWGDVDRRPMSNVRRATARHMEQAWSIPHVTIFDSADITELEAQRKAFAGKASTVGGKLTLTAIAVKVAASALKVFSGFNASIDMGRLEIVQKKYVNIGVAVDTERGLVVPVIRDVSVKNVLQLCTELSALADKARSGKLSVEDMQGGGFTITNLGGVGISNFTPIINSPDVAVLGISRAATQAVFIEGQFVPRLILPLALSFDHRAVDGADAARFLHWIAGALERPFTVMFEG